MYKDKWWVFYQCKFKSNQSTIKLYELTLYRTAVHPSMVIHWKTVSTANKMLSNWVMPSLGPIQEPLQVYLSGHFLTPQANSTSEESTVSLSERMVTGILYDAFSDYTIIVNQKIAEMLCYCSFFDKRPYYIYIFFIKHNWTQFILVKAVY